MNAENTTQVFVAIAGDWSRALSEAGAVGTRRQIWVQGPFASPYAIASTFDSLVMVASGIGITPALGVLKQFKHHREMALIWTVRDVQMLQFFLPMLTECTAMVFFTNKGETLPSNLAPPPNVHVRLGRPPNILALIDTMITSFVSTRKASPIRFGKGPSSLNLLRQTGKSVMAAIRFKPVQSVRMARNRANTSKASDRAILNPDATELSVVVSDGDSHEQTARDGMLKLPLEERSKWAVLYCGGVASLKATLKEACREREIYFKAESFDW